MKVVILLAGKGRRMSNAGIKHKSLLKLDGNAILYYLIKNIMKVKLEEVIPVVGYNGKDILDEIEKIRSHNIIINPVWNLNYETTNNLYSLYQAREILEGEEFISINGDMLFDYHILLDILKKEGSEIAIDGNRYSEPIDSPGVIVKSGRIVDLGRHITFNDKTGYAIGIYKYSEDLSRLFFIEAEKILEKDKNAGFHDPLVRLFSKEKVMPCFTKDYLWTDVDEEKDIRKAIDILKEIKASQET